MKLTSELQTNVSRGKQGTRGGAAEGGWVKYLLLLSPRS
jgi:hypothetical protein